MTNLKTLKDLGMNYEDLGIQISPKELKQEAIKWDEKELFIKGFDNVKDIRRWIKHFFNLTEEDLK